VLEQDFDLCASDYNDKGSGQMESAIYNLIIKAEGLRRNSDYKGALAVFKKAASVSRRENDPEGLLDATMGFADVSRIMGDFDSSVEYYTEALEMCEGLCHELTAADAMVGLALSYRAIGMWQKAMRLIKKSTKTYVTAGDDKGLAFALWAEAGALRVAGKIPEAIKTFLRARDIFASTKYRSGLAYTLAGLGGAHRIAGKTRESLGYYVKANEMFTKLRDTFGIAYTHCGIGNAHRMNGDFGMAVIHFKKAAKLYAVIGDIVSYSYTLWSLATLCKMKEDYAGAKKHLGEARRNFRKTRDPRGLVYCDLADSEILWMKGRRQAAEKLLRLALATALSHKFGIEACHARLLLANIPYKYSKGAAAKTVPCYRKIGLSCNLDSMPFNIP
jgi:tetratricopeptide (TPR) repeat protein